MRVIIFFLLFTPWILCAQERCATESIEANRNRAVQKAEFETWMKKAVNARKERFGPSGAFQNIQQVYSIPVVFHVIHDGSPIGSGSNIKTEKIHEQLAILNADFRRQNADASSTPDVFLPVAADTEIEFVLAKQDPEGLPTSGIVRVSGSKKQYNADSDDRLLKSESFWPPEDYLNIYITDLSGAYLGYAQYPYSNLPGIKSELENYRSTDGVVLDYKWIGNNDSTGSFDSKGRTATHEIGHFLGLRHIWGEGNCGVDDFCDDTPTVSSSNSGTSTPCSFPGKNSCTDEEDDLPDMFQNYMDYTDDACMNLFTICQKQRMRTVLELSPRRASLLSSHALSEPVSASNDLGIREVLSPTRSTCSRDVTPAVQVRNYGNNAISSAEISLYLNDILIETVTENLNLSPLGIATVSFAPLTFTADEENTLEFRVLTVNGQTDGNSLNNVRQLILPSVESKLLPYHEDFNNNASESMFRTTEYQTGSLWTYENDAAYLPFYNQNANFGVKDMLMTQVVDLSSLATAELTFKYAYAPRFTGNPDVDYLDGLIVAVSTNCGLDFDETHYVFERYGTALATTNASSSSFSPLSYEWQSQSIYLNSYTGNENVQIAFIGVNGGGNNIYLDDVEINSTSLVAYDAGVKTLSNAPIVTCDDGISPTLEFRNFGYETINTLSLEVIVSGASKSMTFDNLDVESGETSLLYVDLEDKLVEGTNDISLTIKEINGVTDEQPSNNSEAFTVVVNKDTESIPVKEDFRNNELNWTIASPNTEAIFDLVLVEDNYALVATAYESMGSGQVSYLVSPTLKTGAYQEAAVRFKYSYAQRNGYNDNLKLLLSTDCGKTYPVELLNLNADTMSVGNYNQAWVPKEDQWKSVYIDLTKYLTGEDIRLAFSFTNGGGNNLYLDDIQVLTTSNPEQPVFEDQLVLYPNPTDQGEYNGNFNVTLNLLEKQDVEIRIVDMTGKVVFSRMFPEALNQTYQFDTPHQGGMYLVQMLGSDGVLNQVKRLYVRQQ